MARRKSRIIKLSASKEKTRRDDPTNYINIFSILYPIKNRTSGNIFKKVIYMKFKYLIILLSVGALALLYAISLFSQPSLIALSDLPSYEDKQVMVQGLVCNAQTTKSQTQLLTIRDTETLSMITVYVEGIINVDYGDMILVTGIVQRYNNQWEVVVNNPRFITILQQWNEASVPVEYVAEHPERYLGVSVNLTGMVHTISGLSFYLCDQDNTTSLHVLCKKSPHLTTGSLVTIGGRFLYDTATLSYSLEVTNTSFITTAEEKV